MTNSSDYPTVTESPSLPWEYRHPVVFHTVAIGTFLTVGVIGAALWSVAPRTPLLISAGGYIVAAWLVFCDWLNARWDRAYWQARRDRETARPLHVDDFLDGPDDDLVGDEDRTVALALLDEFRDSGHLDEAEHESRSRSALQARTRGALRSALGQLPR